MHNKNVHRLGRYSDSVRSESCTGAIIVLAFSRIKMLWKSGATFELSIAIKKSLSAWAMNRWATFIDIWQLFTGHTAWSQNYYLLILLVGLIESFTLQAPEKVKDTGNSWEMIVRCEERINSAFENGTMESGGGWWWCFQATTPIPH